MEKGKGGEGKRGARAITELDQKAAKCDDDEDVDPRQLLRLHAREALKLTGDAVAQMLMDKALESDMRALRMLIDIASIPESAKKKRVRDRRLERWLKRLAAEPEWEGPMEKGICKDDGRW